MKKLFVVFIALACISGVALAQPGAGFKVVKTFHIASGGGWDYIAVGPMGKLYVSHGTQVNVLDKTTGDSAGVIFNTQGVHGIAFDPSTGKGYTSNGRLNNVTVFDVRTYKPLDSIATGQNPDAIMYDRFSKRIITCNGRSNDLTIIDPVAGKVVGTVAVGGKPETAVSDDAGKLYVNIEDKNEIAVVDMKTMKVENRWPLAPGEGPTGLEIDKATKRLFAGCDKQLVVMDATNGKIVSKVPIGDGCDGVAFDNATKTIFTSNGEGTMTVIKEKSADDFSVVANVPTKRGARTITIDPATHTLYLPTADYPAAAATGGNQGRPRPVPGTFQILMVQ